MANTKRDTISTLESLEFIHYCHRFTNIDQPFIFRVFGPNNPWHGQNFYGFKIWNKTILVFCEVPILFSIDIRKLGHNVSQFILRSKIPSFSQFMKVGLHLYNSADNSNCRKYVTNCSNVYPLIQLLKMSG